VSELSEVKQKLAVLEEKSKNISAALKRIEEKLEEAFVTKTEFAPVKSLVFGLVGIVGSSVAIALLKLLAI